MRYLLILCLFSSFYTNAQVSLDYYLDDNIDYNDNIPTPKSIIGHEVGEWHVTHDKLVQYMYALANSSNRIIIEETGKRKKTNEIYGESRCSPRSFYGCFEIK